jgi:hypothetical protein
MRYSEFSPQGAAGRRLSLPLSCFRPRVRSSWWSPWPRLRPMTINLVAIQPLIAGILPPSGPLALGTI